MTPNDWFRIKEIVYQTEALPPKKRLAFVEEAVADDPRLIRYILPFLAEEPPLNFIDAPLVDPKEVCDGETDLSPGTKIGPYCIERCIGRGGMGSVYLATSMQTTGPARVALKIMEGLMILPDMVRRFNAEGRILGKLDHPNIARMYGTGVTTCGRPYLVMEYIQGTTLLEYCNQQKLLPKKRLTLFTQICQAVDYAHRNLVVHRDLKPGNILVTPDGKPKLLDFGIARMLTDDADEDTQTVLGMRLMTPEYACPEQVKGEPVTTTGDIYSLGVLLYNMMTGCKPYEIVGTDMEVIRETICHIIPEKPSQMVRRSGTNTWGPWEANRLAGYLSGDVDNIIMMAMRKEPERRYASSGQMAEDITRFLADFPITARADTLFYLSRKFVRRHRYGVALAAALFLSIFGYAGFYYQTHRTQALVAQSSSMVRYVEMVSRFDGNLLKDGLVDVEDRLTQHVGQARRDFKKMPELKARVLINVAGAYNFMGRFHESSPLFEEALPLLTQALGPDHPDTLNTQLRLGSTYYKQSRFAEAEPLLLAALPLAVSGLSETHDNATVLRMLGLLYREQGKWVESEQYMRRAVTQYQADGNMLSHADSLSSLASILERQGNFVEALPLHQRALKIKIEQRGADHPQMGQTLHAMALFYRRTERSELAIPLQKKSVKITRDNFGDAHPYTKIAKESLGWAYLNAGQLAEAEEMFIDLFHAGADAEPTTNILTRLGLARCRRLAGDLSGAAGYLDPMLGVTKSGFQQHRFYHRLMQEAGHLALAHGKLEVAGMYYNRMMEGVTHRYGPDSYRTLAAMLDLARYQRVAGDLAAAASSLLQVQANIMPTIDENPFLPARLLKEQAELALEKGDLYLARNLCGQAIALREQHQMDPLLIAETCNLSKRIHEYLYPVRQAAR